MSLTSFSKMFINRLPPAQIGINQPVDYFSYFLVDQFWNITNNPVLKFLANAFFAYQVKDFGQAKCLIEIILTALVPFRKEFSRYPTCGK